MRRLVVAAFWVGFGLLFIYLLPAFLYPGKVLGAWPVLVAFSYFVFSARSMARELRSLAVLAHAVIAQALLAWAVVLFSRVGLHAGDASDDAVFMHRVWHYLALTSPWMLLWLVRCVHAVRRFR